jgi:HK97 gp10 family phage protein
MASGTYGFRVSKSDTRMGKSEIEGLREVQKALRDLSDDLKDEMKSTHFEAAEIVVDGAKRIAPFRTGQLAKSIRAAAVRTGGRVRVGSADVPYAGPIHFGWPKRLIKPQPFIYDALDPRRGEVASIYAERISGLIIRYGIASDKEGNVYSTRVFS